MNEAAWRGPLLIVGWRRSGTTLLRSVLSQHSQIELRNEPELLWALLRGINTGTVYPTSPARVLADCDAIPMCARHIRSLDSGALDEFRRRMTIESIHEAYELLLPRPVPWKIWGGKSLNNQFFLEEIQRLYPDARFLFLTRDPRSVVCSHLEKRGRSLSKSGRIPSRSAARAVRECAKEASLWAHAEALKTRALSTLDQSRYHAVRFEDMVNDPIGEFTAICAFLGLPFEPTMLDASGRRGDVVLNAEPSVATAHRRLGTDFDKTRTRSFSAQAPYLIAAVEQVTEHHLERLGYSERTSLGFLESAFVRLCLFLSRGDCVAAVERHMSLRVQ